AMAQIMKYWNYPAQGTGSYSYNNAQPAYSHNYGVQSANFGATTYLWDSMPAQVTGPNDAVATLMRHCGVAVAMNYGDDNQGGSGAYVLQSEVPSWKPCAQSAYVNYFNYNPSSIQGIRESDYTPEGWLAVIEHELNEGRPVQYEGLDIYYGGHTWVCDGYDANDFLHMNWGWDGESNGYFAVTSLAADGYDFSYEEAALIGIEPIVNITVTASASALQVCAGQPTTLTAVGSASATYSWEPATGLSCPTCAVTTANPTASTVYTVTMDSAGFTTTSSITVMVRRAITAVNFDTINNVTCNGAGNGSLTVSVQGGTPSYAYMWSNGETSSSISSLSGGTYSLTVTDASGCSFFVSQTISEPTTLSVSVTAFNAGCNNIYGNITSNVTGGSGNFSFNWSNGETTAIGTQMPAGSYTLTVTDDNGCSASASATVAIPAPLQVSVSANDATTGDNGSVSVDNVAQGIGPYAYLWSNGDTTSFVGNVAPGAYTVTVTDVNGCQQTATAQVDGAVATAINQTGNTVNTSVYPNPAKNNVTVNLGKINGQTSISLINSLGQTIKTMNISDVQTNIDLSQVADGIYFIQVKQGQNTSTTQLVVRK
ncbi:MAG TPA: C10 family peptidase, partial [Chitinophagales bacterium]|nr:C10 family peptidase [Chitinophagales bacterium]